MTLHCMCLIFQIALFLWISQMPNWNESPRSNLFKMSNFIIICILHRWSVLGIFCLLEARWDAHAINVKVQEMRPLKHYSTLPLIMNLSYKYLHATSRIHVSLTDIYVPNKFEFFVAKFLKFSIIISSKLTTSKTRQHGDVEWKYKIVLCQSVTTFPITSQEM